MTKGEQEKKDKAVVFCRNIMIGLFDAVLILLSFYSICSTALTNHEEHTFFVRDSILWNLLTIGAVLFILFLLTKSTLVQKCLSKLQEDSIFTRARNLLLLLLFLMAFFWVFFSRFQPGWDQYFVQKAAEDLHHNHFEMFAQDGYIGMFHNQLGLVWISYLLYFIFHGQTYFAIQILNAFGVALFYQELSKTCLEMGFPKSTQLLVLLEGILFFPLTLYSTFVYGTVLGLFFSTLAIRLEMTFFRTGRYCILGASAIAILVGILFKQNYYIFAVAMVLYAVLKALQRKKVCGLLAAGIFVASIVAASVIPIALARAKTGEPLNGGVSEWSFVSMGLQEGDRAPGWSNGWNEISFVLAGYDEETQTALVKADIKARVLDFGKHPQKTVEFFSKKIASEWNNPLFQSIEVAAIREPGIALPGPIRWIISVAGEEKCGRFLNRLTFIYLMSSIAYLFCERDKGRILEEAVFPMVFLGGFLFHVFWEAKGQYTLPYFVLLFPYAAKGIHAVFRYFRDTEKTVSDKIQILWREKRRLVIFSLLTCVLIVGIYLYYKPTYLVADTNAWEQYVASHTMKSEI